MKHFITFEGIDGSGKSTVSKKVFEKLKKEGYDVVWTCEPTDTWLGMQVKKSIEKENDPFVTAFTFTADRIMHGKQIKKWLSKNKIVLCDRYAESTYAYQAAQMQDTIDEPVRWLKELAEDKIPIPDRTFLFDIDPKSALSRISHRDDLIPFEKTEFLTKVRKNYLELCTGKRFLKVDASKKIKTLVDICYKDILAQ
jgi:dTMP kinase